MTTPMMAQWAECKQAAEGALLLFRMGDFYEAFHEDAEVLARALDLTLTKRQEIPMAGVPAATCDAYLEKLVAKGFRVAVAEQTEDPKLTKKLVRREVMRIVTPGTVIGSSFVCEKRNNFVTCLTQVGQLRGLAALDVTTGDFRVTEVESEAALIDEVCRIKPAELLTADGLLERHPQVEPEAKHVALHCKASWFFALELAYDRMKRHFHVHSLDGLGLGGKTAAIMAAGSLLAYLSDELCLDLSHIHRITPYETADGLCLDLATQRNLELVESLRQEQTGSTLLAAIDRTETAMGGRLLRQWIIRPLRQPEAIQRRQNGVQTLFTEVARSERLRQLLRHVRDLERLIMRISSGYGSPRDVVALRFSLEQLPAIREEVSLPEAAQIAELGHVVQVIAQALVDEPPAKLGDGSAIRSGFCSELDQLRSFSADGKAWLATYQTKIRNELGVKTAKVSYNRVFGYYIEVSKGQAHLMPDTFQRRQTLTNSERFISPELKSYEAKALTAEERIGALEAQLFQTLREEVAKSTKEIVQTAQVIAYIDCINGLATIARDNDYVRPEVDNGDELSIEGGRHPVIEHHLLGGEQFIPNDTELGGGHNRLVLITGPNMAGKSTYIRQVALITILAQMGSFVPAKSARIGVVDKLFTRIGASDDLARGQSTFMVEMSETANILNNATDRSLVILDEIGRGTSTYDGVSIAWSVAEYLLKTQGKQAKTLFATHYFELTQLEDKVPGAVNYTVAVHEDDEEIVFLHKIVRGKANRSYGIHVARLAGLPAPAVVRARQILAQLEGSAASVAKRKRQKESSERRAPKPIQLTLFD